MRRGVFSHALAAFVLCATAGFAANLTKISVVVKTQSGKPVDRASVVVRWSANKKHPAARFGRAVRTTYELRTNQEGEASIPAIPQGSIRVQVIAKGYQTFGQVFDVDEEEKTIDVTLNPPQQQYSAH